MPLDIPAIAAAGTDKAWLTAASVLSVVTLRDVPTVTTDHDTGEENIAWATEITLGLDGLPLTALLYSKKQERGEAPQDASLPSRTKMAMLRAKDLPGITEISTKAVLVEGSTVWHILESDAPPGHAIHLLRLRQ